MLSGALALTAMALAAAADDASVATASGTARPEGRPNSAVTGGETAAATPGRVSPHANSALDKRVELLARELGLDATQRLKVRALLESQREQVRRLWDDVTIPGALRVKRTQSISAGTEDGIRAILTADQRQKYTRARPPGSEASGTPTELATWMDAVNRR